MSSQRREEDDAEVSFAGIVDLGSMPPPASGQIDVHRAPTAVSSMTDELVEEIRRARDEARLVESQKTKIQPKFHVPEEAAGFTDETPTRPGKEKSKDKPRRPSAPDLLEPPIDAGVAVVRERAPLPPIPPVSFAETIPRQTAMERLSAPRVRPRLWPRVLFFVVTVAALVVSAFALRRYRARLRR